MHCTACGSENPPIAQFCSNCGLQVRGRSTLSGGLTLGGVAASLRESSGQHRQPPSAGFPVLGGGLVGRELDGRYRLVDLLAQGGMGSVFLAEDLRVHRSVVVKFPHPALMTDPRFVERFQREIAAMVHAHQAGVVRVLDCGDLERLPYLVLEHMEGGSLEDRLRQAGGRFSPREVLSWLQRVAEALDQLHQDGILHRDVKPANILFDKHDTPYLADFGIAKALGERTNLTRTGMMAGSPDYMAPEQASESKLDGRVDQYALGTILFQVLSGTLPFQGDTALGILVKKQGRPEDLGSLCPELDPALARVVMRALEGAPARRFSTCAALAEAYRHALARQPSAAPPPLIARPGRRRSLAWPLAALVGVLLVAAGGWLGQRQGWFQLPWPAWTGPSDSGSELRFEAVEPADGALLRTSRLSLSGRISPRDAGLDSIHVAGQTASVAADGSFHVPIELKEGRNRFEIEAGSTRQPWTLVLDSSPPEVVFSAPSPDVPRAPGPCLVTVQAGDAESVRIAGRLATRSGDTWQVEIELTAAADILAEAWDGAGNRGAATRAVPIDASGPELVVVAPPAEAWLTPGALEVRVRAAEAASLSVDGIPAVREADGLHWRSLLQLQGEAAMPLLIAAQDALGNTTTDTLLVHVDGTAPEVLWKVEQPVLLRTRAPQLQLIVLDGRAENVTVEGDAPELEALVLDDCIQSIHVDGEPVQEVLPGVFLMKLSLGADGPFSLPFEVRDAAGNLARSDITGTVDSRAPQATTASARIEGSVLVVRIEADEQLASVQGLDASASWDAGRVELRLDDAGQQDVSLVIYDLAGNPTRLELPVQRSSSSPEVLPGLRAVAAWWEPAAEQAQAAGQEGLAPAVEDAQGMRFALIPAGEFEMGSPASEPARGSSEVQHHVILTRAFYLAASEVSQAQYEAVMGINPAATQGATLPVESVSWVDAARFCNRLSALEGLRPAYAIDGERVRLLGLHRDGYRLPTEAEWEYACRAGTSTAYASGELLSTEQASYDGSLPLDGQPEGEPCEGASPVMSFPANRWGLYDMHGNILEWCADDFGGYSHPAVDPLGPVPGASGRVVRGGSWYVSAAKCRSAWRGWLPEQEGGDLLGFRVARSCVESGPALPPAARPSFQGLEPVRAWWAPAFNQSAAARREVAPVAACSPHGISFALIPAGRFVMGSPGTEPGRDEDETLHKVQLTRSFYLSAVEVSQAQYEALMGTNPSKSASAYNPVDSVSWNDAVRFCNQLSLAEGLQPAYEIDGERVRFLGLDKTGYRLPTEAEWEYACRAGSSTPYATGEYLSSDQANYDASEPLEGQPAGLDRGGVFPVTFFAPNPWGIYGMHGNVKEWCNDLYGDYSGRTTDPIGADEGTTRVFRGGSYDDAADLCRSANRADTEPTAAGNLLGFRLARSLVNATTTPLTELDPWWTPGQAQLDSALGGPAAAAQNALGMRFALVPAGRFSMGAPESEPGRDSDEDPHLVTLTRAFHMAATEVTQAQYRAVLDLEPSSTKGDDLPVEQVSWRDAARFCNRLSEREGLQPAYAIDGDSVRFLGFGRSGYRLPTEAEWEYACRAGTTTAFWCGDALTSGQSNYDGTQPMPGQPAGEDRGVTLPVGSFAPNPWGLYDMHGNVMEWCGDRYALYLGATIDPFCWPRGDANCNLRGGNFTKPASECRSSYRNLAEPGASGNLLGFRVVRPIANEGSEPARTEARLREVADWWEAPPEQHDAAEGAGAPLALQNGLGIDWVLVPAGSFQMGSLESAPHRDTDETRHEVTLTRDFYLAATELTQAQYRAVLGHDPSSLKGDDLPVHELTWLDAVRFCNALSLRDGLEVAYEIDGEQARFLSLDRSGYRLPTEAEWEYACRAGTTTAFETGDHLSTEQANYDGTQPLPGAPPGLNRSGLVGVRAFAPNGWGIYGMHGNVKELCEDWYADYVGDAVDPQGPNTGENRAVRGGSWDSQARHCRAAYRGIVADDAFGNLIGFRPVRTIVTGAGPTVQAPRLRAMASWWTPTSGQSEAGARAGAAVAVENSRSMRFALIPAGTFAMGSPEAEAGRDTDEVQHTVTLTRSVYISATEVTQTQYSDVTGHNPANYAGAGMPVEQVSWFDAVRFCNRLSAIEGLEPAYAIEGDSVLLLGLDREGYRLPTEAEWEYACRAGTTSAFATGASLTTEQGNYDGSQPTPGEPEGIARGEPLPGASLACNAWGLYEMHGNLWEWCWDRYGAYSGDAEDPSGAGPESGVRVNRGGGFMSTAPYCRSAWRDRDDPSFSANGLGFRVVRSIAP